MQQSSSSPGIFGKPDFSSLAFTVNGSKFTYGHFLNVVISFIPIAAAVFYFVVLPMQAMIERSHKEPPADPTVKKFPECLSEIPLEARRCTYCASEQS